MWGGVRPAEESESMGARLLYPGASMSDTWIPENTRNSGPVVRSIRKWQGDAHKAWKSDSALSKNWKGLRLKLQKMSEAFTKLRIVLLFITGGSRACPTLHSFFLQSVLLLGALVLQNWQNGSIFLTRYFKTWAKHWFTALSENAKMQKWLKKG